jgi:hypothetical protein
MPACAQNTVGTIVAVSWLISWLISWIASLVVALFLSEAEKSLRGAEDPNRHLLLPSHPPEAPLLRS